MGYSSGAVDSGNHGDGTARTLGSQSGVAINEVEVEHAYGTGASNNTPNSSTPFNNYIGRHIVVRVGLSNQEARLIVATSTSTRLQVKTDWVAAPVSGDSYMVTYRPSDDSGGSVSQLSGAPDFWLMNNDHIITSTGAWGITGGTRITDQDNGTAGNETIGVRSGTFFMSDGGALMSESGNPGTRDGDDFIQCDSGSFTILRNISIVCMRLCRLLLSGGTGTGAGGIIENLINNKCTYQNLIKGNYIVNNYQMLGTSDSNEWVEIDPDPTINGITMLNTFGIRSESNATDHTMTILNPTWFNPGESLRIENNKKFHIVNPIGLIHNSTQVAFHQFHSLL